MPKAIVTSEKVISSETHWSPNFLAIIGKYVELKDAYKSLDEALTHGGIANNYKVNLIRIESDFLKPSEIKNKMKDVSGILIPGGFGKRGTEGKIKVIKYVREKQIPFLGICLGMQLLFSKGTEDGNSKGLEFLNGKCEKFKIKNLPIPHIGFNHVEMLFVACLL